MELVGDLAEAKLSFPFCDEGDVQVNALCFILKMLLFFSNLNIDHSGWDLVSIKLLAELQDFIGVTFPSQMPSSQLAHQIQVKRFHLADERQRSNVPWCAHM